MDAGNTKGLMPHREHEYPVSRDWQHIDCQAVACKWNRSGRCSVPSLATLGVNGRCIGFSPNTSK